MAAQKPIFAKPTGGLARFQTGDFVPVEHGGTGADTEAGARTALGLAIGTDVQGYSAALDAFAAMGTVGYLVQTAAGTYTARALSVGAGRLAITNANGVAGATVLDLATLADAGGGALLKLARDAYGRVSGTSAVAAGDLTTLLNGIYAALSGATFTGPVTLSGSESTGADAASRQFVLDTLAGAGTVNWPAVRAASDVNVNIASPGASVGGVTASAGERFLLAGQTTGSQVGIYVWNGAAVPMTRAADADASAEFQPGRQVFVNEGTYADSTFAFVNDAVPVLNTTTLVFTRTSGAGQIDAGNGLTKTANTLAVGTASSARIVVNADNIDLATVGNSAAGTFLKLTVDAYGRVTGTVAVAAADIAPLLDADLIAIAAIATSGSLHRTGTNTWASRTLTGTAGRIAITNGNGVSGNPTVDLVGAIVAPGTYDSVTVDEYGRVVAGSAGGAADQLATVLTNGEAGAIAIGRAVYSSGASAVRLATANADAAADVIGIVGATTIASAAVGPIVVSGVATATTTQWDAVTGQTGGLTPGARYYLSNTTAGALTTTAPTTGYVVPVGKALSTTKLLLAIGPVVQL